MQSFFPFFLKTGVINNNLKKINIIGSAVKLLDKYFKKYFLDIKSNSIFVYIIDLKTNIIDFIKIKNIWRNNIDF